ncbi:uncharacterized protein LOC143500412 isoform X2 [Brachyhypopomus gauderio]
MHEGSHLNCCGTSAYNILESSCCNNEVTHGLGQAVSDCCGSKAHNPINQICCEGKVHKRPGAQARCCGSVAINEATHLCCNNIVSAKTTVSHLCCGTTVFDSTMQCCCSEHSLRVENRSSSTCCPKNSSSDYLATKATTEEAGPTMITMEDQSESNQQIDTEVHTGNLQCDSHDYNKHTSICCSGKLLTKKSGLTQCCGTQLYEQWEEEGTLCCNGVLYRDQPAGSVCTGDTAYSLHRYTVCQKEGHLPAGEHCCGSDTFNPHKEICCEGHRHSMTAEGKVCCGHHAYNPRDSGYKCCSGHLHDIRGWENQSEAQCCGSVLLSKKKQCCHSTEQTVPYEVLEGHSCCGHLYYDMSLWRCCAGHLTPLTKELQGGQQQEFKSLPPLSDYNISAICREKMLLRTVVSEAVNQTFRSVVLTEVLYIWNTTTNTIATLGGQLEVSSLDHCSFPFLESGRTYLWSQDEPIARITDVVSALHYILTHCHSSNIG